MYISKAIKLERHEKQLYKPYIIRDLKRCSVYIPMIVSNTVIQSADLTISGFFFTADEIAPYAIVLLISELMLFPAYTANRIVHRSINENKSIAHILKYIWIVILGTTLILFVQHVVGRQVILLLLPQYDADLISTYLSLLWVYILGKSINIFVVKLMIARAMNKEISKTYGIGAIFMITSTLGFMPTIGVISLPLITSLCEFSILIISMWYIIRQRPFKVKRLKS